MTNNDQQKAISRITIKAEQTTMFMPERPFKTDFIKRNRVIQIIYKKYGK